MKKIIVALLIMVLGCDLPEEIMVYDPRAINHIETFKHEAAIRGIRLPKETIIVIPQKRKEGAHATCLKSGSLRYIYIDPEAPEEDLEMLIFHELGHCLLNKKHDIGGIMSPAGVDAERYQRHRDWFIDNFFLN